MPPSALPATECLVPVLRYRDVAAAAQWLCTAFQFEQKTIVPGDSGGAVYAELVHGRSTIMLVPVGQSDLDAHMRQPDELGGIETQTCYVTVDDAEAHLHSAMTGGAEIVLPLSGEVGGQRGYSCRDPEGHLWNFGTYAPAIGNLTIGNDDEPAAPPHLATSKPARGRKVVMPAMTLGLIGLGAWAWAMPDNPVSATAHKLLQSAGLIMPPANSSAPSAGQSASGASETSQELTRSLANLQSEARQSHETILKLRQEVAEARAAVKTAQDAARTATADVAAEDSKRGETVQATESALAKAAKLESDLIASKASLAHLESELLKERSARGQMVQAAEAMRAELDKEGQRRQALEQIVDELDRKADDRMAAPVRGEQKSDASQTVAPQSTPANTEASRVAVGAAPPETGSIEAHALSQTQANDQKKSSERSRPSVERSKSATIKKPRTATAAPAKSPAPMRHKEAKPWPYDTW